MNERPTVTLQEPELFWLLLGNVRYAMGRMSTAPMVAQDAVRKCAHALRRQQLAQIAREVREELARCEANGHSLGMECDHRSWMVFADAIEQIIAGG